MTEAKQYADAIRQGDRRSLARAITWIESTRPEHQSLAQGILEALVTDTGRAARIGITGPPGVGKSTFIESFGLHLLSLGHRVAVLAVDPSSPVTGGSILGDKTRMEQLAQDDRAFIRPSPSGGALGGVAHRTREALLLCEAAGFDVVIVETVGIGQSEIAVRSLVDTFLVMLQPGSGDELQGIKKGALELADALVVNKADGEQKTIAERTRGEHEGALALLRQTTAGWKPRVLSVSSLERVGLPEVWETIQAHREALAASGELEARRRAQASQWMWTLVEEGLGRAFRAHPAVAEQIKRWEADVEAQRATPAAAARALLEAFRKA
ncbi:MAG: methylmalonyl Co-A mutase-associated GTPase MeaB [bacterium]|nr:methylmalonyl Co-A mutase-associated GTPase MeaB [bacterium]MCP5067420.1 methylmalonyl Co-A mutase-associated GTPase MeaB [bacterium]